LVADVVGYSRLLNEDEAGTLAALRERRRAVVEPLTKQHSGRIVKFLGDGVLIEFASAVNAVAFALDLQRRMAEMNEPVAEARRIRLRIGINLGEVVGEGADIFGDGVNVASRLEALAEPGGVVISGKVHEEVRGKLDADFADLGEQQLKNIARPVCVYRLTTAALPRHNTDVKAPSPLISVAVLPFTNMSGDASQEYFADGLTEDLITALAKSRHLHVLSRNATFEYKGRIANIPEVGLQLGARYVLEGSVRTGGSRVRVTVQLIDSTTSGHVWAERFDRELADVFAVQDEIIGAIAGRLSGGFVDLAAASTRDNPTANLTAYDRLLRGRATWRRGDAAETREHWTKAVEADPRYAPALAGLAFLYGYDVFTQVIGEPIETLKCKALHFAERAIAADDNDFYTHHCLGTTFLCLGDLDKARHHLETAVTLNPHLPNSLIALGNTYICMGSHQEGLVIMERGFAIDPRLSAATRGVELEAHLVGGNFDAAREAFNRIESPFAFQYLLYATCLALAGRTDEASRALGEFEARRTPWFDVPGFIACWVGQFRLPEDRARLRDGFRKLGFEV
jgi:TolB-like protein